MKKSIFILVVIYLSLLPIQVFAQAPSLAITVSPSPHVVPTTTTVDYTLPYPGILTDNPLYPLKTLRDNIIGWLINDPLEKAKFDLLQSDKRLQIGVYLIQKDKSKTALAISTISKGENYLSEAVTKARQAKKQGEPANDTLHTLHTAILKHEQVTKMLESQVAANQQTALHALYTQEMQLDQQLGTK